ncbi:hypothetical protein BLSTO_04507 [Blastocystis sp. subtype 1]
MGEESGRGAEQSAVAVVVAVRDEDRRPAVPTSVEKPVSTQPVTAKPVSIQPVCSQPARERVSTQPVTAQPVRSQPVTAQPVTAQPVTAQPVARSQLVSTPAREPMAQPAKKPLRNPFAPCRDVGREIDENIAAQVRPFKGTVFVNPLHSDSSPEPVQPVQPVQPVEPLNPFDASPVESEEPEEPLNPFDTSTTEPLNPFDESPVEPLNPFDASTTTPLNPFDASPVEPLNPFDASTTIPLNPFDESSAEKLNPFDASPAEPLNPFDASSSDDEPRNPFLESSPHRASTTTPLPALAQRAEPFTSFSNPLTFNSDAAFNQLASAAELTNPQQAFAAGPIPTEEEEPSWEEQQHLQQEQDSVLMLQSNAPTAMMKEMEVQQEKASLEDMRRVYDTNHDEYLRFLERLRLGVHCVKWCSNGQKHKTVLRLVEIGERKYLEWERKQTLIKKKPGRIDVDSVEAIESVFGTNCFEVYGSKSLTIECFSSAGKMSLLPGLQKLCGQE